LGRKFRVVDWLCQFHFGNKLSLISIADCHDKITNLRVAYRYISRPFRLVLSEGGARESEADGGFEFLWRHVFHDAGVADADREHETADP
jgi:hypothetical protein